MRILISTTVLVTNTLSIGKKDYNGFSMDDDSRPFLELGRNIVKLRERAGMSQADLIRCSGVSKSVVNKIELGRGEGNFETRELLAKTLGVSVSDLYKQDLDSDKPDNESGSNQHPLREFHNLSDDSEENIPYLLQHYKESSKLITENQNLKDANAALVSLLTSFPDILGKFFEMPEDQLKKIKDFIESQKKNISKDKTS